MTGMNLLPRALAIGIVIAGVMLNYDVQRGGVVLRYRVITTLSAGYIPESVTLDLKKSIAAYALQTSQGSTVVVGRYLGDTFEQVGGFFFSPDDSRIAYLVRNGVHLYIILDGRPLGPFTENPVANFSPNGKRFIFANRVTEYVYIAEGWKLSKIKYLEMRFSSDGEHSAYLIPDGTEQAVLLDGVKGPAFQEIYRFPAPGGWDLVFSANGEHIAYTARVNSKVCLVLDNEVTKECYQDIVRGSLQINGAGSRTAYIAVDNQKEFAVVGGHTYSKFSKVLSPLVLSSDWSSVAYAARNARSWRAVFNGSPTREYEEVSTIVLSSSGKRFAFIGRRKGKNFCVVDGIEGAGYYLVFTPQFSSNGKRSACVVVMAPGFDSPASAVIDGRRQPQSFPGVPDLVFSPDGSRVAIVESGAGYVVLDGNPGTRHFSSIEGDTLVFSSDSRSLAYVAWTDEKRALVVVDNKVFGPYAHLIEKDSLEEKGTGTLSFVPGTSHVIYRVERQNQTVIMMDGIELSEFACTLPREWSTFRIFTFYGCWGDSLGKVTISAER